VYVWLRQIGVQTVPTVTWWRYKMRNHRFRHRRRRRRNTTSQLSHHHRPSLKLERPHPRCKTNSLQEVIPSARVLVMTITYVPAVLLFLIHLVSYYLRTGWHFVSSSKTCGSLQAFLQNLIAVYTIFSHPAWPSRDIPSPEAYCVSNTKSPNKKILLSSVLCSFKFSIITVWSYLDFAIIGSVFFCYFHFVCCFVCVCVCCIA